MSLPDPWDYCYEWDGPYGTRKFSSASHNGARPARSVPIFTAAQMRAYAAAAVEAERKRHMNPARLADAAMTFAVYEVADENRTAGELIAAMRVIFGNALIDAMIRARSKPCKP